MDIEKRFRDVGRSKTFQHLIEQFQLDRKAVLDIGCSFGEFLAHFGKGSVGLSISKEEAEYGRSKGLDIRVANIESDKVPVDETFDVIFANNIFEHLYSPHRFLSEVKRFLKPDGILILGVPCMPRWTWLIHFSKFRGSLATQHINFFTRDTLIKTVERAGWIPMMARGFHFASNMIDRCLDSIYPHVYVVAKVDPTFTYSEKRLKELAGYSEFQR